MEKKEEMLKELKKSGWVFSAICAVFCAVLLPAVARADTITYPTVSFGAGMTPVQTNWGDGTGAIPSVELCIPQFDPSMGQLLGVFLHVHAHSEGTIQYEGFNNTSPQTVNSTVKAT